MRQRHLYDNLHVGTITWQHVFETSEETLTANDMRGCQRDLNFERGERSHYDDFVRTLKTV